jgi:hypothetical protein
MGVFSPQFRRFLPRHLLFGSSPKEVVIGNAICSLQPLAVRGAQRPAHFEYFVALLRINSCILSLYQGIEILGHFIVTVGGYLTSRNRAPICRDIIGIPDMLKTQVMGSALCPSE